MCNLCGDKEQVEIGRKHSEMIADRLSDLATKYRWMAQGYIKPHSDEAESVGAKARFLIRLLVEEWV